MKKGIKKQKLKFFSYTFKRTRWQGALNLTELIEFLKKNKKYASITELEIKNNSFIFRNVEIPVAGNTYFKYY